MHDEVRDRALQVRDLIIQAVEEAEIPESMFAEYKQIWTEKLSGTEQKPVRLHAVSTRLLFEALCFAGQIIMGRLSQLYVVSRSDSESRAKAAIEAFNGDLYVALVSRLREPVFSVLSDFETGLPLDAAERLQRYLELVTPQDEVMYLAVALGSAFHFHEPGEAVPIAAHFAGVLAELAGAALRQVFGPPKGAFGGRSARLIDYYEVLQVSRDAEPEVIDMAYKALVKKHHPDVGGDVERMKLINEAYHVLRDPGRRKVYDRQLSEETAEREASASREASAPRSSEESRDAGRPGTSARRSSGTVGESGSAEAGYPSNTQLAAVTVMVGFLILMGVIWAFASQISQQTPGNGTAAQSQSTSADNSSTSTTATKLSVIKPSTVPGSTNVAPDLKENEILVGVPSVAALKIRRGPGSSWDEVAVLSNRGAMELQALSGDWFYGWAWPDQNSKSPVEGWASRLYLELYVFNTQTQKYTLRSHAPSGAASKQTGSGTQAGQGTSTAQETFGFGSSKDEVRSIMGTPTAIYSGLNQWSYGLSSVTFDGTVVSGWDNTGHNLKVYVGSRDPSAPSITLGSTMDQVILAMGTPSSVYPGLHQWSYGLSTVNFSGGVVNGWNNIGGNLKVFLGVRDPTAPAFSVGSTKAEVLAAMGTPTAIWPGLNTWDYELSSVSFTGDLVSGWNDISKILKIR
ncbi:MAG: DnaJ domain-containing protein [Bacillota bacterium]